jgi:hypothetical protein
MQELNTSLRHIRLQAQHSATIADPCSTACSNKEKNAKVTYQRPPVCGSKRFDPFQIHALGMFRVDVQSSSCVSNITGRNNGSVRKFDFAQNVILYQTSVFIQL